MESQLTTEDLQSLVNEVSRFANRSIAPMFERPEHLVSNNQLNSLTQEAIKNGLLNSIEETGVSLWETTDDPLMLQFSCDALYEFALKNSGLAYLFHHTSLSYYLIKQLGFKFKTTDVPVITLQGHYGLARHSLARYFTDKLNLTDINVLQDYFATSSEQPSVLHSREDWTHLIFPIIDKNNILQFSVMTRNKLALKTLENNHGLNEVNSFSWHKPKGSRTNKVSSLSMEQSKALYSKVLQMQWLALINIACGATHKAYYLAKEYASMRVQGGKTIECHPAVQQMLAQTKSSISCSQSLVANICTQNLSIHSLTRVAQVRSQLHPLLCQGANHAMQVFGGMGYMQDTGLEKIVRDNTQLKLLNGTPTELMLFLAELERDK